MGVFVSGSIKICVGQAKAWMGNLFDLWVKWLKTMNQNHRKYDTYREILKHINLSKKIELLIKKKKSILPDSRL